jgi:hypothetical protein
VSVAWNDAYVATSPGITARLFSKVGNMGGQGCWEWEGSKSTAGYGRLDLGNGKTTGAHRAAYLLLVGPIPDQLPLDHLCRNRACIRPSHLEPVTNRINVLRGVGITAKHAVQTHCRRGHPFGGGNLRQYRNKKGRRRLCMACRRQWFRDWRARLRALPAPPVSRIRGEKA